MDFWRCLSSSLRGSDGLMEWFVFCTLYEKVSARTDHVFRKVHEIGRLHRPPGIDGTAVNVIIVKNKASEPLFMASPRRSTSVEL